MPRYRKSEREKVLSETRQKLVQAAILEFSQQGFANANINRISEAAGLAKGTVYNYFASKQELMLALIREIGAFHLDYIASRVRQEQDPILRLERFYSAGFDFVEGYPAEANFLITTLYGANIEYKQAMYQAYLPMFQIMGDEILTAGIAQGAFKPSESAHTASLLLTIYLGTCSQVDQNGKVYLSAKEVSDFVLRAIRS